MPAISKMVARMQACRMVRTLDPTEVPNVLATSLAPTPKARIKDTMNPATTIHRTSGDAISTTDAASILNLTFNPIS